MKNKLVLLSLALYPLITACTSSQKSEPPPEPTPQFKGKPEEVRVDIEGLKRSLGLDRSRGDLGYEEKRFNTCNAGFGYPRENCKQQVFISINFRLQCRDTTGTTSEVVTSAQMDPIANKQVSWQIGKTHSTTQTDSDGYGQINGVLAQTPAPRGQRLRLSVGSQFVYMRAGEITRIVTPANWCSSN